MLRKCSAGNWAKSGTLVAARPCVKDGGAFTVIAEPSRRYGIELDPFRAEQARAVTHEVIHGNAFDVHGILMCVESAADAVITGDVAILKRLLLENPGCAISAGLVGAAEGP